MIRKVGLLILILVTASAAAWAVLRYVNGKRNVLPAPANVVSTDSGLGPAAWEQAVARVKEDRSETHKSEPVETPPELRHYSDRHWFLATQVAEVAKYDVKTCQDFLDLAAMIERGDFVSVPAVTDAYVLYGVGKTADDSVFSRYEDGQNIELYTEAQLSEAYRVLEEKRTKIQNEIAELKGRSTRLKKSERTQQKNLQKQISALEADLKSSEDDKARLDRFYGDQSRRQALIRDYNSLKTLAQSFGGRSFNIDAPSDRIELKINLLSSLRPAALKVMKEVAAAYLGAFDRPLPVSSLARPEQYQRALRRVNRNAVLIETPPHSTGLAFDIDYRYMSGAEQNFLMRELARLKNQGRIEVIRESNANYHVFAFLNGTRPSDELITAALEKASEAVPAAHHVTTKQANIKKRAQKSKTKSPLKNRKRGRRR